MKYLMLAAMAITFATNTHAKPINCGLHKSKPIELTKGDRSSLTKLLRKWDGDYPVDQLAKKDISNEKAFKRIIKPIIGNAAYKRLNNLTKKPYYLVGPITSKKTELDSSHRDDKFYELEYSPNNRYNNIDNGIAIFVNKKTGGLIINKATYVGYDEKLTFYYTKDTANSKVFDSYKVYCMN